MTRSRCIVSNNTFAISAEKEAITVTPSVPRVRLVATWVLALDIILVAVSGCFGGSSVSTPSTYTVSGRVTDLQGKPIPRVGLLFDSFGTATTDADGRYTKSGLSGTVKVIPKLGTLDFDPYSRTVSQPSQNVDFVGMEGLITISRVVQTRETNLCPYGGAITSDTFVGTLNLEKTPERVVQMKATTSATWEDVEWKGQDQYFHQYFSWSWSPQPSGCQVRLLDNGVLRYLRSIQPAVCEHITNVRLNGQPLSDTLLLDPSQPLTVSWDWRAAEGELKGRFTLLDIWVKGVERYTEYTSNPTNSFTVPAYTFFPGESGQAEIRIRSNVYADEIEHAILVRFFFCFQMAP